jgi:YidC/Oxa1 family membrane protein insertase
MEKRVLLAVVLSFIVLYGYQALFPPLRPEPPVPAPDAAAPPPPPVEAPAVAAPVPPPAPADTVEPVVADTEQRDIVMENEHVRAVFSTRGAVLTSWRLKRYLAENDMPLEIVPDRAPAGSPLPFTLSVEDPVLDARLAQALFQPSATSLDTSSAPGTLTFEFRDASGLSARKVFSFSPEQPYLIDFTADVQTPGMVLNPIVHWGPALGTGIVTSGLTYSPSAQPIFYRDGDVNRIGFGDVPQYRVVEGQTGFAGVDDHYFLSAVLPDVPVRLHYEPAPITVPGEDRARQFVSWAVRFPSAPTQATFFAGPKDFDVLEAVDRDLVRAIHFGVLSPLVVPLLRALKWVNGYVGNYGWSIVLLTIMINMVMFPLRHKSVVSMRKMQAIQPEMKAIQERYAKLKMSDPARSKMNTELMNLYRERGVNPASGCIPMLLTLPVLFAFYSMLSVAIELRGAPFVGWIRDLSVYDPWFVTPVVMGATQFLQTKLTPATADPAQQRIMLLMPLIFMTMFIWAPSGLVLYWTVSNMWAIGQQVVTNKIIGPPPQRAVRPPAERRVKQAGAGKTAAAKERK